jgi:hypothetical protein
LLEELGLGGAERRGAAAVAGPAPHGAGLTAPPVGELNAELDALLRDAGLLP